MPVYTLTVPCFSQMLKSLTAMLAKGEQHARELGCDPQNLLDARLAPDMHNLAMQVRFACTQARESVQRLTAQPLTSRDTPRTMAEAHLLIEQTLHALSSAERNRIDEGAGQGVSIELQNGMAFDMSGAEYVLNWAIPQFYFHLTTAYNILRHNGVLLGKGDFVQHMVAYARKQ